MKRIMVDMSATLVHHGHIRLLAKARAHGRVIVALTTDEDILRVKGYEPELGYAARKEILEAIRHVDEVVPSPWKLDQTFLDMHRIDLLVHGDDNANVVDENHLLVFERTSGISSTELRHRACRALEQQKSRQR
jgi:glycerol-3-phosphate cytidylyltransferase